MTFESRLASTVMLLAIPAAAWARHSFPAEFDQKQIVKLKGTVVQFEWANPHAMIRLEVKNGDGTVTQPLRNLASLSNSSQSSSALKAARPR